MPKWKSWNEIIRHADLCITKVIKWCNFYSFNIDVYSESILPLQKLAIADEVDYHTIEHVSIKVNSLFKNCNCLLYFKKRFPAILQFCVYYCSISYCYELSISLIFCSMVPK